MTDKVLVYQGDEGLLVEIPVESVEIDEDTDMIYFNYNIIEGTAPDNIGELLGKYILDLIEKYAKEVIETRTEQGAIAPFILGVNMRNFVAKNARTYNRSQIFIDRKKASKLEWYLEDEMEPPIYVYKQTYIGGIIYEKTLTSSYATSTCCI